MLSYGPDQIMNIKRGRSFFVVFSCSVRPMRVPRTQWDRRVTKSAHLEICVAVKLKEHAPIDRLEPLSLQLSIYSLAR